ncbi:hypothetical protein H5410_036786 [Solanum commersonii]|uniref:Uncharacterized protein n=1 Tax=Solanum commersonii TaxID=4109 RepID=A0A9J5Y685_SOLCO|nr:hypothetical protein H5410_036786 [Solanum commersonii]
MMKVIHHPVWKGAGIYRAIKSLVYRVQTYQKLIFGLVTLFCPPFNPLSWYRLKRIMKMHEGSLSD